MMMMMMMITIIIRLFLIIKLFIFVCCNNNNKFTVEKVAGVGSRLLEASALFMEDDETDTVQREKTA
jgi:hypothetical protein